MPELTVAQAFNHAVALHNTGRAAEAESLYRQILAADPNHLDAMQMLGVLLAQTGKPDEGLHLVQSASRLNPNAPSCHANIGMILAGQGKLDEAIQSFRHALSLRPDSPETLNNLANALSALGRHEEAIDFYRRSIALNPRFPDAHSNLGTALCATGRTDEGIACFRQAVALNPKYVGAHFNLAKALYESRHLESALEVVHQALSLRPDYPEALMLKGVLLQSLGHHDAAIETYQQSLALRPNDGETLSNLASAHLEQRRYDRALELYRQAIAANPNNAEAYGNYGKALGEVGLVEEGLQQYRKSLALKPQSRTASGMLLHLHLHPDITPREILHEHRNWARTYTKSGATPPTHPNDRNPDRRIRIGYVSPDFTYHPVGRFMLPILAHHDRGKFEVFCYSDARATDAMTERLRSQDVVWRDTSRLSDNELVAQVRDDRIDVLVDLIMHSKGSRLLAFAQKPAPVQVSYLAYASTTGIDQIDYRVSDPYLDPPGGDESVYSEKILRLPNCFWCYQPLPDTPDVGPPPFSANGYVTFGCLNNFWKVTRPTLDLWLELLSRVPDSRLVLLAHDAGHRRLREAFAAKNLHPDRLTLIGFQSLPAYLAQHTRIDIALDPFPYGGGTTTCEALWMGAPVVTLPMQTAVSRAALSILSNVGLTDLVAQSKDHYLHLATDLANNPTKLSQLRSSLRDTMRQSPLMNAPQFTSDFETLLRQAWQSWCKPA